MWESEGKFRLVLNRREKGEMVKLYIIKNKKVDKMKGVSFFVVWTLVAVDCEWEPLFEFCYLLLLPLYFFFLLGVSRAF